MIEAGVDVALSSDAPVVVNDNPLAGVRAALDRQTDTGGVIGEHESISIEDALAAYTKAGAALAGQPNACGTIEPGKWADLVVLDRDPLETPFGEFDSINVDMTLVGGKVAFER